MARDGEEGFSPVSDVRGSIAVKRETIERSERRG
jgi:hypothetical protein